MVEGLNSVKTNQYVLNYSNFKGGKTTNENEDESIFASEINTNKNVDDASIDVLNSQLEEVNDSQGVFKKAWNGFKNATTLGVSSDDCEDAIEKYKKGEITFDEASAKIDEFKNKQDSSLNLFSNMAASLAAIGAVALVAATGGAALPVVAAAAIGAGTGAVIKAGYKAADRATNEVKGDTLDAKQLAKDALSGAVTGGISTVTMGTAGSYSSVGSSIVGCAKTGVVTGAVSGSSNYAIDCAFDENKDFDAKEFVGVTAQSAAVGGTVGAVMGGINGGLRVSGNLNSGCNLKTMAANNASSQDVVANSVCTSAYKVGNDRVKAVIS